MCGQEYKVEPIGNLVDAVFDCYARHAVLPVLCKACCNDTLPLRSLLRRDDVGLVFSARGGCVRFLGGPGAAPAAPRLRLGHDTESTPSTITPATMAPRVAHPTASSVRRMIQEPM